MNLLTLAKNTIPNTADKIVFRRDGQTEDIVSQIKDDLYESIPQTREFALQLYAQCGRDAEAFMSKLYHFIVDNVNLVIDPVGFQFVKKPSALIHASERKADCKSFSIFFATCLYNVGIPCRLKFCSWSPGDKNVRHVFVEAFPDDPSRRRVLDANLKSYGKEKTPNYNNIFIDMTKIYSVGSLGSRLRKSIKKGMKKAIKKNSLLDGRNLRRMTQGELALRVKRQGLRTEKELLSRINGIGDDAIREYDASIAMLDDAIGECVSCERSGNYDRLEHRLAGVGFDYVNGYYHTSPSVESRMARAESRRYETRTLDDLALENPQIAGLFSKIKKAAKKVTKTVSKAGKSVAKVAKNTVKTTTKAVATTVKKATTGSLKMVKAATLAPAALVSSKARAELKSTVKSAANDAKAVAQAQKDILTAPIASATAEILENHLPKAGSYFLYTFMDDATAEKAPSKVQKKRTKANKLKNFIVKYLNVKASTFNDIIRNACLKQYGKTPEAVIEARFSGSSMQVAGIGVAITAIISAVIAIINLLCKLFKKKKSDAGGDVTEEDVPSDDDWGGVVTSLANTASNVVDTVKNKASNLSTLTKVTGNVKSLANNLLDSDLMNAAQTATDILTNRTVDASGNQEGAKEALQATATAEAQQATQEPSKSGLGISTPLLVGGAVVIAGGAYLLSKK